MRIGLIALTIVILNFLTGNLEGQIVKIKYDNAGRLVYTSYSNKQNTLYVYDDDGNRISELISNSHQSTVQTANTHNLRVFPNPTDNRVIVMGSNLTNGKYILEITGASGKLISRVEETVSNGTLRKEFSFSNNAPGVYLISIVTNNTREYFKIIKK